MDRRAKEVQQQQCDVSVNNILKQCSEKKPKWNQQLGYTNDMNEEEREREFKQCNFNKYNAF